MRRWFAGWMAMMMIALTLPAQAAGASAQIQLSDDAQTHNALLAASAMNGYTLAYEETFSFNALVGPRAEEYGYVSALNGRGAEVVGGGVAQAATALYLALLDLDPGVICFDELAFYGDRYAGSYVEDGSQAIMVDYAAGRDFRFTSYFPGDMTLVFTSSSDALACEIVLEETFAEANSMAIDSAFPARQSRSANVAISCGEDPAVLTNIALAADSIYDLTLATGDVFSFNTVVGPRDERCGYVSAVNGRGAEVIGGGVGQVASALWLLVQNMPDVAIVEKSTYGSRYTQSYVSNSSDAILVDYGAGTDFVFRYTGSGYLTLYTYLDGTTLYAGAVG